MGSLGAEEASQGRPKAGLPWAPVGEWRECDHRAVRGSTAQHILGASGSTPSEQAALAATQRGGVPGPGPTPAQAGASSRPRRCRVR